MQFQCPSCGFRGGVRTPAHLPKGKTVRIRCSRCQNAFPLSLGRLFPQEYTAGYQALVADSLGCVGTRVGQLWMETVGSRNGGLPVLVLPPHPALSHDVMHDLLDSFGEYFRTCYIEFPGTRRNPQEPGSRSPGSVFSGHVELIKNHLGVPQFHLLTHLGSAAVALEVANRHPDSVASVVLIEPDLRFADPAYRRSITRKLKTEATGGDPNQDPEQMLVPLLLDVWTSDLPEPHVQGLAKILSPGFHPDRLNHDLLQSRSTLRYTTLSRSKTPVLVIYAQEGGETVRRDALYLRSTLPAAETTVVEKGGAWAAWFHHSAIANRLLSFKRSAESREPGMPRKRSHTLNGQPLAWMVLVFAVLASGLTLGSSLFRFQPAFMSRFIPALLSGLLPILWFVIPKRVDPIAFFRFRRLSLQTVLLPLAIGAVLGAFYRGVLLVLETVSMPVAVPAFLISLAPGSPGRILELAGIAVVSLFVFAVAENLWVLRRSRFQILMPTLLFALLPPAFPDILWRLPVGFAASVLFASSLSFFSPLFLIAGFAVISQLTVPFDRVPVAWGSIPGVILTTLLLAAAIISAVLLGTGGKPLPPEELYFTRTISREDRLLHWNTSLGVVIVIFSLIAAAAFVFSFIAV